MIFDTDITLIKDSMILIICATTCLYCMVLSRRLKGLNSLKSGIRGSINTLTESIQQSHSAAKQVQLSAAENIETLNKLLDQAERAAIKIEALTTQAEQRQKSLSRLNEKAQQQIETDLPQAIGSARKVGKGLGLLLRKLNDELPRAAQKHSDSKNSDNIEVVQPELALDVTKKAA